MAASGRSLAKGIFDEETNEMLKKIRRHRELVHGRFPDSQCGSLLRHFKWNLQETVTFIFDGEQSLIREITGEDEMCQRKRDAIPEDQEYGWAKFQCQPGCSNEFHAFGMMDMRQLNLGLTCKSKSLCWGCRLRLCEPICIIKRMKTERGLRGRYTHECTAYNCYNRCLQRDPKEPIIPYCVHPRSLKSKVPGEGSDDRVSTGSTVETFLTQTDSASPYSTYEPSLADIGETRSEFRGDNNGDNGDNF